MKGRVVAGAARCTAPSGGAACVAASTNVVDGCIATRCVGCGDGIVQPSEECEPPGVSGCTETCTLNRCGSPAGETLVAHVDEPASASVAAGAGGYLVTWAEGGAIRARRLDAAAAPVDPAPLALSDPLDGPAFGSLVTGDPGGWYVAWSQSAFPDWSVAGLHITAGGTLEAQHTLAEGTISGQCYGLQTGPLAVASEGDGRFASVLADQLHCIGQFDLFGHTAIRTTIADGDATSVALGSPDPIEWFPGPPTTYSGFPAAIAHTGGDTVMVITQEHVGPGQIDHALYARWLPVPGDSTRLSSVATLGATREIATAGGDGQFVTAWANGDEVRAVRFTRGDGALDPEGGIVLASNVSAGSVPAVAFDGTTWLVVWHDVRTTSSNVLGVRLRPDGTIVDPQPCVLAENVYSEFRPSLASRGSGWLLSVLHLVSPFGLWSVSTVPIAP